MGQYRSSFPPTRTSPRHRLTDVTHAQVAALVANNVTEDYDLDFKRDLYGRSDSDKRACATDVAAMANTAGGLIILVVSSNTGTSAAHRYVTTVHSRASSI